MTQIHLWFLKTLFLWFALVPPSPLLSICRYRHGIVILFGCLCRSSNTCALEDILTMGEELRRKPVSGFAVYWLQMWWELNWFTLWDQHDNLLALGLQWATQVENRHLGRAWKSVFVVVAMMTDRYVLTLLKIRQSACTRSSLSEKEKMNCSCCNNLLIHTAVLYFHILLNLPKICFSHLGELICKSLLLYVLHLCWTTVIHY